MVPNIPKTPMYCSPTYFLLLFLFFIHFFLFFSNIYCSFFYCYRASAKLVFVVLKYLSSPKYFPNYVCVKSISPTLLDPILDLDLNLNPDDRLLPPPPLCACRPHRSKARKMRNL